MKLPFLALGCLCLALSPLRLEAVSFVFNSSAPLLQARSRAAVAELPDGRVLVAGGYDGANPLASAEIYDPATGQWSYTGNLSATRADATATVLPSGQVLVVGGYTYDKASATAVACSAVELFDPASGTWIPASPLAQVRSSHTATLLPSGLVLVAGGYDGIVGPLASCELYHPRTDTWSPGTPMPLSRLSHTSTLLADGSVLVAGGVGENPPQLYTSALRYFPATGSWVPTGSMATGRIGAAAERLLDGRVLVVAGTFGADSAECYDPVSGNWTPAGTLSRPFDLVRSVRLPSGKVLVVGGSLSLSSTLRPGSVEVFDPGTGTFLTACELRSGRAYVALAALPDGGVLVAGGVPGDANFGGTTVTAAAEILRPAAGDWSPAAALAGPRVNFTATTLTDGRILVAGGQTASYFGATLSTCEIFDPGTGRWTPTGTLKQARDGHVAVRLPDGKVLVAGGANDFVPVASSELFDPATGAWRTVGGLAQARFYASATLLGNGTVLLAGGNTGKTGTALSEIYHPATENWTATGSLQRARAAHTATLLNDGSVLIAGGADLRSEIYDPATGTFALSGPLAGLRRLAFATRLGSGKVLIVGGELSGTQIPPSVAAEVFDPATGVWTLVPNTPPRRLYSQSGVTLPNGQVLVSGGLSEQPVTGVPYASATADIFDPTTGTWTATAPHLQGRYGHRDLLLPDGRVLAIGGGQLSTNQYSGLSSCEFYQARGSGPAASPSLAEVGFPAPNSTWVGWRNAGVRQAYRIQASSDLTGGWQTLPGAEVVLSDESGEFSWTEIFGIVPQRRLYRAMALP